MGDCGSLFLGFILGALAIMGLSKGRHGDLRIYSIHHYGRALFYTSFAIIRRLFLRKPVFEADKMHLHHSLLSLGMSHSQTVLTIYALALTMGLCAVLMAVLTSSQAVFVLIFITIITFAGAEFLGILRGKRPAIISNKHHVN